MSSTTQTPVAIGASAPSARTIAPIRFTQLVSVEMRKMVDTRSGFWMLVSVGLLSVVATGGVILFAPDALITYESFTKAVVYPMSVILPVIAILAVTSEWSQRSGLTTFTLAPWRGRVIGAKAVATLVFGLASIAVAFAVGTLGNIIGSALAGNDTVWDVSWSLALQVLLGHLVGMAIGFTLGVVMRNSAAALVGYFVLSLVLPGVLVVLAQVQEWFADVQPWIDWNQTQVTLFDGLTNTGEEWARLASTSMIWIVVPLAFGLFSLRRSEIK